MERLTKRGISGITYNNSPGLMCSCYCDNCSKGTGDCDRLKAMVNRLAKFEDLEEQGLLVRLPCKVGDTVYKITRFCSGGIRDCGYSYECSECPEYKPFIEYIEFKITILKDIGKTVFLTREEAERKLEEMKNE
jgi:hypothetical protein